MLDRAREAFGRGDYENARRLALEAEAVLEPKKMIASGGIWFKVRSWLRRRRRYEEQKQVILDMIKKIVEE